MSAAYNGYVLPMSETVQGYPRFSWKMVAMMLHLYRGVSRLVALNGCSPRWVHMASERDAPVVHCPTVHLELSAHPYVSRMAHGPGGAGFEHSQWTTLWAEHAIRIAGTPEHEESMLAYWLPRFAPSINYTQDILIAEAGGRDVWSHSAPDEIIIPWELTMREDGPHARAYRDGFTYVDWGAGHLCSRVDNFDRGERTSPCAYVTFAAASAACGLARHRNKFFVRKIGNGDVQSTAEVVRAITEFVGFSELQPSLPPPAPPLQPPFPPLPTQPPKLPSPHAPPSPSPLPLLPPLSPSPGPPSTPLASSPSQPDSNAMASSLRVAVQASLFLIGVMLMLCATLPKLTTELRTEWRRRGARKVGMHEDAIGRVPTCEDEDEDEDEDTCEGNDEAHTEEGEAEKKQKAQHRPTSSRAALPYTQKQPAAGSGGWLLSESWPSASDEAAGSLSCLRLQTSENPRACDS